MPSCSQHQVFFSSTVMPSPSKDQTMQSAGEGASSSPLTPRYSETQRKQIKRWKCQWRTAWNWLSISSHRTVRKSLRKMLLLKWWILIVSRGTFFFFLSGKCFRIDFLDELLRRLSQVFSSSKLVFFSWTFIIFLYFFVPHGKLGSPYLGRAPQLQEQGYPFLSVVYCIFMCIFFFLSFFFIHNRKKKNSLQLQKCWNLFF